MLNLNISTLLAILNFTLIIALVTAVPDSVITGPYKVSFDLGLNHSDYNVTIIRQSLLKR
jgi:hypothetical protein